MFLVSEIETEPVERTRKVCRAIDENCRVLDLLFLAKFAQEQHGELCRPRLKQPCVQDFVRRGIDCSVQPVTLVVDLNHGFVHCDVIRLGVASGLYVGFLYPVVNRCSTPFDT
jgi:hypothetical protein